jgi:hypothetical protein
MIVVYIVFVKHLLNKIYSYKACQMQVWVRYSGTHTLLLQDAMHPMNTIPATRWQRAFKWEFKNL